MLRLLVEKKQNAEPFEWFEADGIAINPKESLQLRQIDDERDPIDLFVIKNTGNNGLLFKIKTTSPEKFRVRPSVGFIPPHESDYVRIQLQNEYRPTLKAERFLFMGIRTNNENIENFGTLWKESAQREPSIHSINNENTELRRKITELGQRQMIIIFMLLFLLIVHFLFVVQLRSSIDNLTDAITQTQHNSQIKSKRSDL
uniref:Major sperm protein n=1 Tax=Panagrolaimus sp. PS1159 TaxID=55785 RepID=A0AC35FYQ4_9BILA